MQTQIRSKRVPLDENLTIRFVLPVLLENMLTIANGLVFYQLISTISRSALAATGIANQVGSVISSAFSVFYLGSAVLVSRQIGAHEYADAKRTIEQSTAMTVLSAVLITLLCIITAVPLMRMLMPNAEESLFQESVRYYRILLLSVPLWMVQQTYFSISRAVGNSKAPMAAGIIMNVAQTLFAYCFIKFFRLNEIGAGLAYICCRIVGLSIITWTLFRDRRYFTLSLRDMLRPHFETWKRIIRLGIPICVESVFVQVGYLVANSMSIALGTFESGVYQIMTTLNSFITMPQAVVTAVGMTVVGHILGSGRKKEARKAGRYIWAAGLTAVLFLGSIVLIFSRTLSGFYSSDPAAVDLCVKLIWILPIMDLFGVSINAIDPQLRAGGDVTFVMILTLGAIWLVKLPLTWLFCFKLNWGVIGIFAANASSLFVRAVWGFARHCGDKWMKKRV